MGSGSFHGADVTLRFSPADAGHGLVFVRTDLPDRPAVPARIDTVIPSQRRTTIRQGAATVEMIEHVMAALAGLRIDNCVVEIDAGECPGCDGSSRAFVEALDRAGIVEQIRDAPGPGARTARSPSPRETPSWRPIPVLRDDRRSPITSIMVENRPIASPELLSGLVSRAFRDELAASRTFLLEAEADALAPPASALGRRRPTS